MSSEQPRVRHGVPDSGQWTAYGHDDSVPDLHPTATTPGPVFGLTPEYFNASDQMVYDRHEQLLIASGIEANIEDNPVLLGGRTEFVATTAGRRFILGVTDTGVSVHRDPDQVPSDARDTTGFIIEIDAPTVPEHIFEAMDYAVRRACFDDALHRTGITSNEAVEFSNFTVHEAGGNRHAVELTIATANATFRLETRGIEPGAEYGITDFRAGRFLTGRVAEAVLISVIAASGQKNLGAEGFVRKLTDAAAEPEVLNAAHHREVGNR